ncbi:MAG: hypothetical protein ACK47B_07500 [Armatimonadota bacterium]
MSLRCAWSRKQLERHADLGGELPAGLAAHLERCAACRTEWQSLLRLSGELAGSLAIPAAGDELVRKVLDRLSETPLAARRSPSRLPALATAGGLAAAAAVGAAVLLLNRPERPGSPAVARRSEPPVHGTPSPAPRSTAPRTTHAGVEPPPAPAGGLPTSPKPRPQLAGAGAQVAASPRRLPPAPWSTTPGVAPTREGDDEFLDGRDLALLAQWTAATPQEQEQIAAVLRSLPPAADDFVRIPLPRLAGRAQGPAVAAAVREYEQQAKVVDPRLFRKVTLRAKGAALAEVAAQLQEQTGVQLRISRALADEKATVLVKDQDARSVMRAVARLFGALWGRTGEEGAYRYELVLELKSQLAEEELRNRDLHAALLELDSDMQRLRPYTELPFAQAYMKWEEQSPRDKSLFNLVNGGGWGGTQLYHRLTPGERAALVSGEEVVLRPDDPNPDRRLPGEWSQPILQSRPSSVRHGDGTVKIQDVPGIRVTQLRLKLHRSELGELTLSARTTASWPEKGYEGQTFWDSKLATARNPSAEKPGNAQLNAALRGRAPFDRRLALRPEPSCPALKPGKAPTRDEKKVEPHVTSADVWEAIHQATALPIVADYYTRIYPQTAFTRPEAELFDTLCEAGDALGVRWTKDGDFLLARSTSYFWDKLKEVPNRELDRWQRSAEANGGLPFADFLEIAGLPDPQLSSSGLAEAVMHCRGIPEWHFLGGRPDNDPLFRTLARYLTILTPAQLRQALEPEGVPFRLLSPAQQQATMQRHEETMRESERQWGKRSMNVRPEDFLNASIVAEYVPAGWYKWTPTPEVERQPRERPLTPIAARTAEEALAAARRIDPGAAADQVRQLKHGHFTGGIRFHFR